MKTPATRRLLPVQFMELQRFQAVMERTQQNQQESRRKEIKEDAVLRSLFFFLKFFFFLHTMKKKKPTERTGPSETADICLILRLPSRREVEAESPTASVDYKGRRKGPTGLFFLFLFFFSRGKSPHELFHAGVPSKRVTIEIYFLIVWLLLLLYLKKKKRNPVITLTLKPP